MMPSRHRRRWFQGNDDPLMHLLIDALSVNNLSGRHVLVGHVRELAAVLSDTWRFTLLTHRGNADLIKALPQSVAHVEASTTGAWWERWSWGLRQFDRMASARSVDLVLSPSGMLSPGCSLPQIVLAQNPWPLVANEPGFAGLRLWLQRRGFARAQGRAWRMVFNSHYMEQLYRNAFGAPSGSSVVAYQGVADDLLDRRALPEEGAVREQIVLSVSVMARHKAIEVLVRAFAQATRRQPGARLVLVGQWPDDSYRTEVLAVISELDMQSRVDLLGHVDADALHALYGRARVFCLLSRCESFGIPAVEAQAAGMPVVVADGTAAPEIAGAGAMVVPMDDVNAAADAIAALLTDDARWAALAQRAQQNAARFRWRLCSLPLVEALRAFETQARAA
jgi:glycosyltransferase involved in cell wall biosynthesis